MATAEFIERLVMQRNPVSIQIGLVQNGSSGKQLGRVLRGTENLELASAGKLIGQTTLTGAEGLNDCRYRLLVSADRS